MSLANVDTDLIRKQVKELEKETSPEGLNVKYAYLFDNFPSIFYLVRDKTSQYKPTLNFMLESIDKIKRNEVSLEEKNTEIYDMMDERYVKPVAEELERIQKEKETNEVTGVVEDQKIQEIE